MTRALKIHLRPNTQKPPREYAPKVCGSDLPKVNLGSLANADIDSYRAVRFPLHMTI